MAVRVLAFEFSTTTSYIIEVGPLYFRFYTAGAQVLDAASPYAPVEVTTTYASGEVDELQFKSINDVIKITHPDHHPADLTRTSATSWTLADTVFDAPALEDENLTETTITVLACTGVAGQTGVTMQSSAAIFNANHVGSTWRIGHKRDAKYISKPFSDGAGLSGDLDAFGPFSIRTYGLWTADVDIVRVILSDTGYEKVYSFDGQDDRNIDAEAVSGKDETYRIRFNSVTSYTNPARCVIERPDAIVYGTVKITGYTSTTEVTVTVVNVLEGTGTSGTPADTAATEYWSEAAWSDSKGFPRACAVHEQRVIYGGNTTHKNRIWGSKTGDLANMDTGTSLDDEGFRFDMESTKNNEIQWMESTDALVIGTAGAVFRVRGDDLGSAITPSKVDIKKKLDIGSEYIQPELFEGAIFFVERQGRKIRELIYDRSSDTFTKRDVTLLAEHLFTSGIVRLAFQRGPIPTLWVVNTDGDLLGGTYDLEQNVLGWHKHDTGLVGKWKSVASIYGASGANDEVWFVILRTATGGAQTSYIERFNPTIWTNKLDGYFVDSGTDYDGSAKTTFTGIEHLNGETIDVLADGVVFAGVTVTNGGFILATAASRVHYGLAYTSVLQPFRLDADSVRGVHMGQEKLVEGVTLVLKDTVALEYYNGKDQFSAAFTDMTIDSNFLYSGDLILDWESDYSADPTLTIKQTQPLPSSILAVIPHYNITG